MRAAFPYLLVAPALIYLLAITLYPGIFAALAPWTEKLGVALE